MVNTTLIGQKSSLNKFSRYIKWCKSSSKRVRPSTRRDMTSIVLITVSRLEMNFGVTLVRRGLKETVMIRGSNFAQKFKVLRITSN
jgi:hypothetical protein